MRLALLVGAALAILPFGIAWGAATNPNISIVGQPFTRWTDDAGDPAARRAIFDVGETEVVFDDYLNPYARGFFTLTLGDEGAEVEEAFFTLLRGLPGGLALKGGKYRAGFGRLNPVHAHAYPFAERFDVLAAHLPGEEALNEVGAQLSARFAAGDWAVTTAADVLQGDSFRIAREPDPLSLTDPLLADPDADRGDEPRPALLGRVAAFAPIGGRSGFELGFSAVQGTGNVAAAARTTVLGGDAKLKWWTSARAYLLVQGELLRLDREDTAWDDAAGAYVVTPARGTGGYLFADFNWNTRYNAGASYERFQDPGDPDLTHAAFGLFAGLALMEETTAFRVDWKRLMPGAPAGDPDPEAVNAVTLRVIYSLGPHKAHQF